VAEGQTEAQRAEGPSKPASHERARPPKAAGPKKSKYKKGQRKTVLYLAN